MGTYRRNMWFLVPWAKEWTSDIPDLRELCKQIRRLYNSRRQLDVISTVCDELLAKENLPKARSAELYCYLAGIASDSEETFEAFKLNYMRAEFALADVESHLKAYETVDLVVAAVRTTLDAMRQDLESLEPKIENHGGSDLAAERRVEAPLKPFKNPMLASGQQKKTVSTAPYQETVDLHEELAKLEQYKQRLAASHEERKRQVNEERKRMDRIAEAKAAKDESLSSEDSEDESLSSEYSEYESLLSDADENKEEMEAKDQDKMAAKEPSSFVAEPLPLRPAPNAKGSLRMKLQNQQLNGGLKPRPSKLELRKLSGLFSKEDEEQEQKEMREQQEKRERKKKQMMDKLAKKDGAS